MRGEGALRAVEAAYRLDLDDAQWLASFAEIARTSVGDPGLIHSAAIYRSHADSCSYEQRVFAPHDDAFLRAVDAMDGLGISVSTVQTHLTRAMAKTGIANRARLVRVAATLADRLGSDN